MVYATRDRCPLASIFHGDHVSIGPWGKARGVRATGAARRRCVWVALLATVACGALHSLSAAAEHPTGHVTSTETPPEALSSPPVLENLSSLPHTVEVNLTAAPALLNLIPGKSTPGYAFNGHVPGPTLEAHEGDHVIVHFWNQLPEPTTIHWHGLHLPAEMDGSPLDPVLPGARYDYTFTIPAGQAGVYWYHPHPHHLTGAQVARGLYGGIIIRPAEDPLPASLPDRLLILSDNRFRPDGTLDFPSPISVDALVDEQNGREGNVLFVNGQIQPTLAIRSGEVQRWRLVNASAARYYRLSLGGQPFLHVGSDGGLFERPVERSEILLAPAERVELLVTGSGAPGSRAVLQALPYDRYLPQTRPKDWDQPHDLLTLQYTADPPITPPVIPATLRKIPPLDPAQATTTREIVLEQGLINGKVFDANRVDIAAPLGATEIWDVENVANMDHPFHLHGFSFQVLDRDGVSEPFPAWKDTVNVPPYSDVRFIVRYTDFPGKWMFHCHILDHEDHGMMAILEVR
jgi:FtsP/CotA-like multicopper oxidase with cupredoxin domain